MIQKLKIQNFQAHKNLELELKPGINLILGDSNIGKTSIIRALQLLLTGNPKTPIYASGNPVKIEMILNNKVYSVEKTIKKDKVTKTIWNVNGQEYDGANFKPDIGLSEINIQSQFEPFYMLSKTPGQIGKEIQIVTGINLADEIKTELNTEINTFKTEINRLENSIKTDKKELSEYPDLKQIRKQIRRYERIAEKRKKEENRLKEVEKLLKKYHELKQSILVSKKEIQHLESIKDKIEKYETESIKIREEKKKKQGIMKLIEKVIRLKNDIEKSEINIDKIKKEYQKELGDICPTCGSNIDKDKLERIL